MTGATLYISRFTMGEFDQHHNFWCPSKIFQVPPTFQQGLKLWGFGKQKLIRKIFFADINIEYRFSYLFFKYIIANRQREAIQKTTKLWTLSKKGRDGHHRSQTFYGRKVWT